MTTHLRPLDPERVAGDTVRRNLRHCGKCKQGIMSCTALTEHTVNHAYTGRDYTFRCDVCGYQLQDFNSARMLYQVLVMATSGGFGGLLFYFGLKIGLDTFWHGAGGNDASAVAVVLALFLLGGGGLLALTVSVTVGLVREALARRQSPVL